MRQGDIHQVDIHEAKTHLSRLVDAAAKSESFIISKAGKPMGKVVPVDRLAAKQRIGFMEGEFDIRDDFDRLSEDEIARLFGGYSRSSDKPRP